MAFSMSCGLAVNGKRFRWCGTMPENARLVGNGKVLKSIDSKSVLAPLGGAKTGRNPTDRGKKGSKIHILVDQRRAPLAVYISNANQHNKWFVEELVFSIVVPRPSRKQHLCADKGYDYPDVHHLVLQKHYIAYIKHHRRRGEPKLETLPPSETQYPDRRWVVERAFSWLVKRRSVRTRRCKKMEIYLAFILFAAASVIHDLAFLDRLQAKISPY